MYVLDTNVLSEFRKARSGKANPNVVSWAIATPPTLLFLSVLTVMELELGTLLMERRDPKQGAALRSWLKLRLMPSFTGRVLPVDTLIAQRCARLHVPDPLPERDALIAATALVHGMSVATRNVGDFRRCGVPVINPWDA